MWEVWGSDPVDPWRVERNMVPIHTASEKSVPLSTGPPGVSLSTPTTDNRISVVLCDGGAVTPPAF